MLDSRSSPAGEITLDSIRRAARRIAPFVHRTPLEYSLPLSRAAAAQLYLKLEVFQPTRVFKLRGASNRLGLLSGAQRKRGVVTASSGNHGLAVAYAAWRMDLDATVFVPKNANPAKVQAIERYGGHVRRAGAIYDDTVPAAVSLARARRATFVPPDDPAVISGQGTIGLEFHEQLPEVECVVVPVGAGGLISGIACAVKALAGKVRVVGVQTKGCPTMYHSWRTGRPRPTPRPKTIADGLCTREPEVLTLALMRRYVDEMVLVADRELLRAMRNLLEEHRLLVEPSGAAAVAALAHLRFHREEKVAVLVSGGNVAPNMLRTIVGAGSRGQA
ncbi:MAG: threonine ammonia-lyase [Anaerolineales bacterium]